MFKLQSTILRVSISETPPSKITEKAIREIFQQYGEIKEVIFTNFKFHYTNRFLYCEANWKRRSLLSYNLYQLIPSRLQWRNLKRKILQTRNCRWRSTKLSSLICMRLTTRLRSRFIHQSSESLLFFPDLRTKIKSHLLHIFQHLTLISWHNPYNSIQRNSNHMMI